MIPLPPRRPPQSELMPPTAPAAVQQPTPQQPAQQGGLLDAIGGILEQMFGGVSSGAGQSQYPGYEWDALQGWVPTAGKDNAGMQAAARAAIAPPAAPDQPKVPVAPVAVSGNGMESPQLPMPKGAGFGSQPIELSTPTADGALTPPTGAPGRFK